MEQERNEGRPKGKIQKRKEKCVKNVADPGGVDPDPT